jgi:hypothetical protein
MSSHRDRYDLAERMPNYAHINDEEVIVRG